MNKEEYLNKIRELLEKENVEGVENIISDIEKKYDLGVMAGLSEDEIVDDLGTPFDILGKYKQKDEDLKYMDMEINDPFSSDIRIEKREEEGIDIRISKDLKDKMEVIVEDNKISIKPFRKNNHFRIIRSSEIAIFYGPNIKFGNVSLYTASGDSIIDDIECKIVKIETVSGDFEIKGISAESVFLKTVSGDFEVKGISAESVILKTVSGDIDINTLKTGACSISTVSGDIDVSSCNINSLVVSTISGDIDVTGVVKTSKCTRISGDININNIEE